MPLHIIGTPDERLAGPVVVNVVRRALDVCGRVVLLAPSFAQALDAQRALTAEGLSLGVTASTPAAWATERWEVWGDGRRPVDDAARAALCDRVLTEAGAAGEGDVPRPSPGTAGLLANLARSGLPWMRAMPVPAGVSRAEAALVGLLEPYARRLEDLGMVELCEVMDRLPGVLDAAGVRTSIVLVGFTSLRRAERELCCGLARTCEVTLVAREGEGPAFAEVRELLDDLAETAARHGAPVERTAPEATPAPVAELRAGELTDVLRSLFRGDEKVAPTGALRLLLPAGPSAEAELVARTISNLADEGICEVVLSAPNPASAWAQLAPRLVARGVSVRAQLSVPFSQIPAGGAFLEYITSVARLVSLDETWPANVPVADAPRAGTVRVALDDMSWWPPRELSDFLASDISGTSAAAARRLDAEWRGNRLLTPSAVLARLTSARAVSPEVAAATRELLRGRLGSSASKLLAPYVNAAGGDAPETVAALSKVLGVAKSLREIGLTADPDDPARVSLEELVGVARSVLARTRVPLRLEHAPARARCAVRIMGPMDAARLAPASADALILLGQTSAESDVRTPDDARTALLACYGVEPRPRPTDAARARFAALVSVPRRALVAERTLFGTDGKKCYPSVMLTELLACYGVSADDDPAPLASALGEGIVVSRSETSVGENVSSVGVPAPRDGSETPAPAGRIDASERALVSPPPEGVAPEDNRPLLSASQIETYLDCPYKWFSLRRLRLCDVDARFSGAEEGTFVHRVLEVTRRDLLARAVERASGAHDLADLRAAHADALQRADYRELMEALAERAAQHPADRLPGSGLDTPSALSDAHAVLAEEFDAHLRHQYQLVHNKPLPQALVAHTAQERGRLMGLRRDLFTLLEYETAALEGFEPRLLEWRFGRRGSEVSYAGALITGTVDRVDVDAHGQAVVIDYKHKSDASFATEYDAFPSSGAFEVSAVPRHVQSLIYAQVIRRAFPDLKVRAAVYLCTKGNHQIAGAVDENLMERVMGAYAPVGRGARRAPRLVVPRDASFGVEGESGMDALLDACEASVAAAVARMLDGDIEARPRDAAACDYCPVLNCERRLRK